MWRRWLSLQNKGDVIKWNEPATWFDKKLRDRKWASMIWIPFPRRIMKFHISKIWTAVLMQYVGGKKREWPWQKCAIGSSDFLHRNPLGVTDNLIELPTALKQRAINQHNFLFRCDRCWLLLGGYETRVYRTKSNTVHNEMCWATTTLLIMKNTIAQGFLTCSTLEYI